MPRQSFAAFIVVPKAIFLRCCKHGFCALAGHDSGADETTAKGLTFYLPLYYRSGLAFGSVLFVFQRLLQACIRSYCAPRQDTAVGLEHRENGPQSTAENADRVKIPGKVSRTHREQAFLTIGSRLVLIFWSAIQYFFKDDPGPSPARFAA